MQIRKTDAQWRALNINPTRVDKFRVDMGGVYTHCSIGEGLRTSWCWRTVTDADLVQEALLWGPGEHEVCVSWLV